MRIMSRHPGAYAVIGLILLDQVTKHLVRDALRYGESVPVTPFLNLTHLTNTGTAFSMFEGANAFFVVFTLVVIAVFARWYRRNRSTLDGMGRAALALVLSGALGNLIDRVVFGRVTDFLDVHAAGYHWPAFNVADSCITVGGILLFVTLIRTGGPVADPEGGRR